jgi:hypothetical protein
METTVKKQQDQRVAVLAYLKADNSFLDNVLKAFELNHIPSIIDAVYDILTNHKEEYKNNVINNKPYKIDTIADYYIEDLSSFCEELKNSSVSFEQAKELKKAGFDYDTQYYYNDHQELYRWNMGSIYEPNRTANHQPHIDGVADCYSAPTVKDALDWLAQVKNIKTRVDYTFFDEENAFGFVVDGIIQGTPEKCKNVKDAQRVLLSKALVSAEKRQVVSFEQAKKIKELGFDIGTHSYYHINGIGYDPENPEKRNIDGINIPINHNEKSYTFSAPFQDQALEWMKTQKNIDAESLDEALYKIWAISEKAFDYKPAQQINTVKYYFETQKGFDTVLEAFSVPKDKVLESAVLDVLEDSRVQWQNTPTETKNNTLTFYEKITDASLQAIIYSECKRDLKEIAKGGTPHVTLLKKEQKDTVEWYFASRHLDGRDHKKEAILTAFEIPKKYLSPSLENILQKHEKLWIDVKPRSRAMRQMEIAEYDCVVKNCAKDLERFKVLLSKIAEHPVVLSKIEVAGAELSIDQKMGLVLGKTLEIESVAKTQRQGSVIVTIKDGKLEEIFKQYQTLPVETSKKKQFKIS